MTPAIALSQAQALVLGFLEQRRIEQALTPRAAEIAVALELPREVVNSAITELAAAGLLAFNPRRPRSLALTPAGMALAKDQLPQAPCPAKSFR